MIDHSHSKRNARPRATVAFSLVEVVVAMGIASFCLAILVGLLPVGIMSNRNSVQESQEANLLQMITADRLNSPATNSSSIFQLPPLTNTTVVTNTIWIDQYQTNATTTNSPTSIYRVFYTYFPTNSTQPFLVNFQASLANSATNRPSTLEALVSVPSP